MGCSGALARSTLRHRHSAMRAWCQRCSELSPQTNCFFRRSFFRLGIPTSGAPPAIKSLVAEAAVVPHADAVDAAPLAVLFVLRGGCAVIAVGALRSHKAAGAAALVDTHTPPTVQARDGALAVFTAWTVVATSAGAGVLLDALSPVQALLCTDASLTVRTLVSNGTVADARSDAGATVHALRIAQRCAAVASHVSLRALADFVGIAATPIGAPTVTLWVWAVVGALLLQTQPEWCAAQVASSFVLDPQPDSE